MTARREPKRFAVMTFGGAVAGGIIPWRTKKAFDNVEEAKQFAKTIIGEEVIIFDRKSGLWHARRDGKWVTE